MRPGPSGNKEQGRTLRSSQKDPNQAPKEQETEKDTWKHQQRNRRSPENKDMSKRKRGKVKKTYFALQTVTDRNLFPNKRNTAGIGQYDITLPFSGASTLTRDHRVQGEMAPELHREQGTEQTLS